MKKKKKQNSYENDFDDGGDEVAKNLVGDILQLHVDLDHSSQQIRSHLIPLSFFQLSRLGANLRHRPFARGRQADG